MRVFYDQAWNWSVLRVTCIPVVRYGHLELHVHIVQHHQDDNFGEGRMGAEAIDPGETVELCAQGSRFSIELV